MPNPNLPADPFEGLDLPLARLYAATVGALTALDAVFDQLDDPEGFDDEARGTAVREAASAARLSLIEALRRMGRRP
jgi:hypothetical protein